MKRFDNEFALNLLYSWDAGAYSHTRRYISELRDALKHGKIDLDGTIIQDNNQLNRVLQKSSLGNFIYDDIKTDIISKEGTISLPGNKYNIGYQSTAKETVDILRSFDQTIRESAERIILTLNYPEFDIRMGLYLDKYLRRIEIIFLDTELISKTYKNIGKADNPYEFWIERQVGANREFHWGNIESGKDFLALNFNHDITKKQVVLPKLFKTITSNQQFNRLIHFEYSQMEHYRIYKQSGGEFVVDFKYTVSPNESDEIKVFYEQNRENAECIPYIFQGVESFLSRLNSEGISIRGFDIEVFDCVIHPVDYKPNKYVIYSAFTLYRFVFDRGIKSVKEGDLSFQKETADSFNSFLYSSEHHDVDRSKYFETTIHLPSRGFAIKYLRQNTDLVFKTTDGDNSDIHIKIFQRTARQHDNSISIHVKKDITSTLLLNSVIEELILLKFDIYSKNFDLAGFDIFLECADLKYVDKGIGRNLYWSLLELVS